MSMRCALAAIAAISFYFPTPVFAQRVPVEITHTGADFIGQQIAREFKDAVAASGRMTLIEKTSQTRMRVVITSADASHSSPGSTSSLAVTYLYDSTAIPFGGAYLISMTQVCGRDQTLRCVQTLMSLLSDITRHLKHSDPRLYSALLIEQKTARYSPH